MKPIMIIAGGTGFLGRALINFFQLEYQIRVLTRSPQKQFRDISYHQWDGQNLGNWTKCLENSHVVINLSGRSVDCRYTESNKKEIYSSRIDSTQILGKAINECVNPPQVWLNAASATIYPESFDLDMAESFCQFEDDFSVDVCKKWERTFEQAKVGSTRKVILRTGIVLGNDGGPLIPLSRLARLGLGGKQGTGEQFCSWLHELDFCRAVEFIINHEEATGVFNITSPNPVRNTKFMQVLRQAIGFPFGIPMPKVLLEAGAVLIRTETELICKSRKVIPARLTAMGFKFSFPRIEFAFYNLMNIEKWPNTSR